MHSRLEWIHAFAARGTRVVADVDDTKRRVANAT